MKAWQRKIEIYGMPVISFVLAVLLWFYVINQKIRTWTYPVSVYVKTATSEIAGWSIPEKVSVELKGPNRIIDRISDGDLGISIALAEIQAGQYTRSIQPSMINGIPAGIEIVRIEPAEVRIELRPLLELRYKVNPQFNASDTVFTLGSIIDIDPKYVEVRGVRDILEDVHDVKTEEILINGPAGKREETIRLIVPQGTRVYPQNVNVIYEVVMSDSDKLRR